MRAHELDLGQCGQSNAGFAVTGGQTVSLYSTINSLNGCAGVCCDFNGYTPQLTLGSVPEISIWAMMVMGVGALGVVLRRRRTPAALSA